MKAGVRMLGGLIAILPSPAAVAQGPAAPTVDSGCELHVWPTENYLGVNTGLLSGFGLIGAIADQQSHKNRVTTAKDLMRDYLAPSAQVDELRRIDVARMLKLDGYRLVVEEPTPAGDDLKANPDLKARAKAMNDRLKSGERLSTSSATCYAELVGISIFYHRAMMYGSNLFAGWVYRPFPPTGKAVRSYAGSVKNPLEAFPPKSEAMIDAARTELRDAYANDFAEYVAKKVHRRPN